MENGPEETPPEIKSGLIAGALAAMALTFMLPVEGHSQANSTPKWLECFSPNECDISVIWSGFHGSQDRLRLLAARAASACQAAGYSHWFEGTHRRGGLGGRRFFRRVYFTQNPALPARPCSFSATAELEAEAKEMARVNGYPWPVGRIPPETEPWTFEPGENDWGEKVPFLDEITSPLAPALRSDQDDLLGFLSLGRDCSVTLMVGQITASGTESDWWAYYDGGLDLDDQILEVRVDGASVKENGRNLTKPTADMVLSSRQDFSVYVRSAEHEDSAAFRWAVTDRDRETVRMHFPHCVP